MTANLATFAPDTSITAGDLVRSFDFAEPDGYGRDLTGDRAAYVLGVVESILPRGEAHPRGPVFPDCDRYVVRVVARVFRGKVVESASHMFPPVNGVPTWSGVTGGVEKA